MNKIELLKFTIERYDRLYESVNNKGNVYLTIITFLIGGTITGFYGIDEKIHCIRWEWLLFYLLVFIEVLGLLVTLLALRPYLKSQVKSHGQSAIYFGDVALMTAEAFKCMVDNRSDGDMAADLTRQAHHLALGLRRKYRLLSYSTYAIGVAIFLLLIIGLIIFK